METNIYAYSREHLVSLIKDSDYTNDGIYWCPSLSGEIMKSGVLDDSKYAYNRKMFENKMYFSEYDIRVFLATEKIPNFDELAYYNKIKKFVRDNYDLIELSLDDYIPNRQFTLEELIDCYDYII